MKKLIILLSSIYFLLFSSDASAQRYPSLDDSFWKTDYYDKRAWDYTFYKNGTCKFGYYDMWYSEFTDCRWSQGDQGHKIKIYANQGWPIGKWNVEANLIQITYSDTGRVTWIIRGKKITEKNDLFPFEIEAQRIDKWIEVEKPKPQTEPRVDNKVTEKYLPPKTTVNEPLRGREKAKDFFSDKFDSAIKAGLGAAFGVLVLFGIDSITGGRIEKKFNLKIAYAIAAFIGWMLTKFI
jgi:hypothetical protein